MLRDIFLFLAGALLGYRWRKARETPRTTPRARGRVPQLDPKPRRAAARYALSHSIPLWIEYTDAGGRTTMREVVPIRDLDNCVQAWCGSCSNLRHFRYDRIRQLRLLGGSGETQRRWRIRPGTP